MADSKHETVIEINADERPAMTKIARVQAALDRLLATAANIRLDVTGGGAPGAPGGGGGGGGSPGGGGGGGGGGNGPDPDERDRREREAQDRRREMEDKKRQREALDKFRGIITPFGAAAAAGQSAYMAANPGWLLSGAGALVTGGMSGVAGGLMNSKSEFLQKLGGTVAAAVPYAGALAAGAVSALGRRYGQIQERAMIDRDLGMAGLAGGGGWGMVNAGARAGYMPGESAGLAKSFALGAGHTGAFRGMDLFGMLNTGTSIGALSGYAGLGAAGINSKTDIRQLLGQVGGMGLVGSKADEILSIIAQGVTQMAQQGIRLDATSIGSFIAQSRSLPGGSLEGARLARLGSGLAGTAGSVRQRLLGPFAQLAEMASLRDALGAGGGIEGAIRATEDPSFTDPRSRRASTVRAFGRRNAALAFASMGVSMDFASELSGMDGNEAEAGGRIRGAGGRGLARALAQGDAAVLGGIDPASAKKTIEIVKSIEVKMGEVADKIQKFLDWVQTYL